MKIENNQETDTYVGHRKTVTSDDILAEFEANKMQINILLLEANNNNTNTNTDNNNKVVRSSVIENGEH